MKKILPYLSILLFTSVPLCKGNSAAKSPLTGEDAGISGLLSPNEIVCSHGITPIVRLKNFGTNTLTTVSISYTIDGGTPVNFSWSGSILTNGSEEVALPYSTTTPGVHLISIVTSQPNGVADGETSNDNISFTFLFADSPIAQSFVQDFESTNSWPYNGYLTNNPDKSTTWALSNTGHTGTQALFMKNFSYTTKKEIDEFTLPAFDLSGTLGNPELSFWLAYQSKNSPLTNGTDTLEVFISIDCGSSWRSIYKKYGSALITSSTTSSSNEFIPAANDWRKETIDLTPYIGNYRNYIRIKNTNNNENNLYLDDIGVSMTNKPLDVGLVEIIQPVPVICQNSIVPQIKLINNSTTDALTTCGIDYTLDNGTASTFNWKGYIAVGQTQVVDLNSISFTTGKHTLEINLMNPNGTTDPQLSNNTKKIEFINSGTAQILPYTQNFESTNTWPYTDVLLLNNDAGTTWGISNSSHSSTKSIYMNNFNYTNLKQRDEFVLPGVDLSLLTGTTTFSFWLAYQAKNNPALNATDTLEVLASSDCGLNWKSIYKKSGTALTTANTAYSANAFVPGANDWRKESVDLTLFNGSSKLILKIVNINNNENNLYIDDINFSSNTIFPVDLSVKNIINPEKISCFGTITPEATIENKGTNSCTSFSIAYNVDNGPSVVYSWTGTLSGGQNTPVNFSTAPITVGQHQLKIFITSSNGGIDPNHNNDTLKKTFYVVNAPAALPYSQDFESSVGWPYPSIFIDNDDKNITWTRTNNGNSSAYSIYMNNFAYSQKNKIDEFMLPALDFTNAAISPSLEFALAYQAKNDPSANPSDSLEIFVSTNCGVNWTSVYKKNGNKLVTSTTAFSGTSFIPANSDWRKEIVDLSALSGSSNVLIKFRNTNANENNLYIDNINISSSNTVGVEKNEVKNFSLYPNPVSDVLFIEVQEFSNQTTKLEISNALGETVGTTTLAAGNKNATFNIEHLKAGIYFVRLINDKNYNAQRLIVKGDQ